MSKTTGKSISSSIQLRVDGYSAEAKQAARQLNTIRGQITDLERSQDQQLLTIGKSHLSEVIAKRVQGCTHELRTIFQQREAALDVAVSAHREASEQGVSLRQAAEGADQAFYRTQNQLNQAYEASPELKQARLAAKDAGLRSDADRRSSEAALVESRQKLTGYTNSVAFMHLLEREFGTSSYSGSLLFAWGDRWLARQINFGEAKQNYQLLLNLSDASKAASQASLDMKAAALAKVKALETEISEASGLSAADSERKRTHSAQDMNNSRINVLEQKIGEFQRLRDSQYADMKDRLSVTLKHMSYDDLRTFVTATPTTEDDAALEALLKARRNLQELRANETDAKAEVDRLEAMHQQAKKLMRHFESEGFDGKRRVYDSSFDVDSMMTGYLMGSISQSMIDQMVRNSSMVEPEPQAYTPPPSYEEPRSSTSSSSWSNSNDGDNRRSGGFSNTDQFGGSEPSKGYSNTDQF